MKNRQEIYLKKERTRIQQALEDELEEKLE